MFVIAVFFVLYNSDSHDNFGSWKAERYKDNYGNPIVAARSTASRTTEAESPILTFACSSGWVHVHELQVSTHATLASDTLITAKFDDNEPQYETWFASSKTTLQPSVWEADEFLTHLLQSRSLLLEFHTIGLSGDTETAKATFAVDGLKEFIAAHEKACR